MNDRRKLLSTATWHARYSFHPGLHDQSLPPLKMGSVRYADAPKHVRKTAIGAKWVPKRLYFEVGQTVGALLVSLF